MFVRIIAVWAATLGAAADDPAGQLFEQAENLARNNQNTAAMETVDQAVAEIDRARKAGDQLSWQARNGLRFAAQLAREDFLDYDKAFHYCDKLLELADTDYWRVPAWLERALTYRAMGEFKKAQREYDKVAAADPRHRSAAIVPQAEMVYFEIGDRSGGRQMIIDAVMNNEVQGPTRFKLLRQCVQKTLSEGDRNEALEWYAMAGEMPFSKEQDRDRCLSQAWYEMGKIEESRGQTDQAKDYYRRAMELEGGQMRYRTRARDALESIEYFE